MRVQVCAVRSPSRFARAAPLAVLMALLAGGCSGSGPMPTPTAAHRRPSKPSAPAEPDTGYPDSMAAIGHSGITGDSSREQRFEGNVEDSWATGTNPEVDSVYARLLAENPGDRGQRHQPRDSAAPPSPTYTARSTNSSTSTQHPNWCWCWSSTTTWSAQQPRADYRRFETDLTALLQRIADGLPEARVFMTSYYADPASYVEALGRSERRQVGGTGPCAIIDPTRPRGRRRAGQTQAHHRRIQRRHRVRLCERRSLHLRRRCVHSRSSPARGHRRRPRAHLHGQAMPKQQQLPGEALRSAGLIPAD